MLTYPEGQQICSDVLRVLTHVCEFAEFFNPHSDFVTVVKELLRLVKTPTSGGVPVNKTSPGMRVKARLQNPSCCVVSWWV